MKLLSPYVVISKLSGGICCKFWKSISGFVQEHVLKEHKACFFFSFI